MAKYLPTKMKKATESHYPTRGQELMFYARSHGIVETPGNYYTSICSERKTGEFLELVARPIGRWICGLMKQMCTLTCRLAELPGAPTACAQDVEAAKQCEATAATAEGESCPGPAPPKTARYSPPSTETGAQMGYGQGSLRPLWRDRGCSHFHVRP